jgi:hypothetical protein
MKLIKGLIFCLSPTLLGLGLAGCTTPGVVQPLSNGYAEVTHPHRSMQTTGDLRVSFEHLKPDGKTVLIWPSLYGVGEVIHGDVAIFVGDEAYVSPDPDDPRGTRPRLFAVKSPGLPVDITDEVLWLWSKSSGKDYANTVQLIDLVTPTEKNNQLQLQLEFWTEAKNWPNKSTLQLNWQQVSDIIREEQVKGTVRRDLRWGTPYVQN